ncbi:MAG TPA: biotin/lipoyl-binding protein, partial [Lysobacter sp.]|nr:biotin/lipoyl-binding protein [Lysobacter sp.]
MTTSENHLKTPAAPAKNGSKRKRALLILALVVVVAGIAWALWYLLVARWHEDTDDAYVQGNVVAVTPQTAGTVVSIGADDGMKVVAGQVLVQLDQNDARVAYEQASANLANTVRQVRGLYSAVDANRADIAARRVAVEKARADVARRAGLVATGAVSSEELAHAREELAAAEAALAGAAAALRGPAGTRAAAARVAAAIGGREARGGRVVVRVVAAAEGEGQAHQREREARSHSMCHFSSP